MIKRLITLTIIDIALIFLWVFWANSIQVHQEAANGVILIVPALIVISGIIGLVLKFSKAKWADAVLANMIIALVIFFVVFKYEGWKQEKDNYQNFYFVNNKVSYNIILKLNKGKFQDGQVYYFYERLGDYGNQATGLDGHYRKVNDTLILTSDKGRIMKVLKTILIDYPQRGDTIEMKASSN